MTREDNIIVPRRFLEVVENTLQIQNNINLDKKTGETCQDRNVRESLNGLCKLLTGEELTGWERLEKLQPSIPSSLDEAAELSANDAMIKRQFPSVVYNTGLKCFDHADLIKQFKAGAEWMAGQGETFETTMQEDDVDELVPTCPDMYNHGYSCGDKVIVQIRKKQ